MSSDTLPPSEALVATVLSNVDEPLSTNEIVDTIDVPISSRTIRHGVRQLAERGVIEPVDGLEDPHTTRYTLAD